MVPVAPPSYIYPPPHNIPVDEAEVQRADLHLEAINVPFLLPAAMWLFSLSVCWSLRAITCTLSLHGITKVSVLLVGVIFEI